MVLSVVAGIGVVFGEHLVDAIDPAAPVALEPVEGRSGPREAGGLDVDDLFAPASLFSHQPRPLELRNVLLDRREADRIEAGEGGDGELRLTRADEDVSPGGVAESLEEKVFGTNVSGLSTTIWLYVSRGRDQRAGGGFPP